jgi:3',5'-cyclic AMP phosphodiesterase CpdA
MRTIIHLSDLHFGRSLPLLIEPLLEVIKAVNPHLIVISGDLTQRARASQFRQARNFFSLLPYPLLPVPGNHDIPLYAVWSRFIDPFKRYQQYISAELDPQYRDDEIAVMGVNSVRRFKFKEGRINRRQLAQAQEFFTAVPANVMKIVVAHHPFNLPEGYHGKFIERARMAFACFRGLGIDLLLSGHLHSTLEQYRSTDYQLKYQKPLIVQAGTTISSRLRLEPNSFNIIFVDYPRLSIERYQLDKENLTFSPARIEHFVRGPEEWESTRKT